MAGDEVACRLVRLACERHLRDLKEGKGRGLWWSPEAALYAIRFFGYLRHSKGEFGGQAFQLSPWQQFIIGSVWGWKRADGTRRFRVVWQEVPRKNGKANAVDTPVATPDGWVRHGDLKPGDHVFTPSGEPARVLAVSGHYPGPCYRLGFSDGTTVVSHDRHEWVTQRSWFTKRAKGSRQPMPNVETAEIAATLRMTGRGDWVHSIPVAAPLVLPEADLPIPPYTLGAWLGDGTTSSAEITCADTEIVAAIHAERIPIRLAANRGREGNKASKYLMTHWVKGYGMRQGLGGKLRDMGLIGAKHIPSLYQRASIAQRREVLAGIVDTDGHVTARGQCEVVLTNERLFRDVVALTRTLGFKPTTTEDRATLNGRDIGPRYRVQFWPDAASLPLRIPRKRDRLRQHAGSRCRTRMIVGAERVAQQMVNCIEVEGGLYLAGEGLVTTHNSTLLAGVGLLALVADQEPGAEVYTAATKRDQAKIIFDEAKRMVASSPELSEEVRRFRSNMAVDRTGSKFEPLSADEKTLDGLNPSCALIDEVHKHKSRAVLDVLDTAMGSRRQPILWQITTAGDDEPESVYAQENDYAIKVLEGVVQDDNLFAFITTIDEGDRWDDPIAWQKANPNYGVSVKPDDLKRQADKAKNSPSALVEFKRLRLNLRTAAANKFIAMPVWARNSRGRFDPDDLRGRSFYGAFDLSSKVDLSCWLKIFPPREAGERWRVVPRFWMPSDTVAEKSDRDRVQYQRWISEGHIEVTLGNVIDHQEIENAIEEDCRHFRPLAIAYDPWNATQMAVSLHGKGKPVHEFVQGIKSYTAPTKELEVWLLSDRIDHGDNPVLTWMASNLKVVRDKNENMMPTKAASIGRIDGMTSLIMSIGMYLTKTAKSPYQERGPRVV